MESTKSSNQRGRGGSKHFWTTAEDTLLVESLQELNHNIVWKGEGGFKNGYLIQLESMINTKLPGCGIQAFPHIESRVKTLKSKYSALSEMLAQSGFGWNDELMMLVCEKSVYEDWVKKHKEASGLYNKPFPHYHVLGEIYGRDRANGTNVGNAADDEEEIRLEDEDEETPDFFMGFENMTGTARNFQFYGLENMETQQPNSSQRRSSIDNSTRSSKRPRAPKNNKSDEVTKHLSDMTSSVAAMAPEFKGLIEVLSHEKELTDMQKNLTTVLGNLGLTRLENFRVTNILAKDHDLLRVFFAMNDKAKRTYVLDLIEYGV